MGVMLGENDLYAEVESEDARSVRAGKTQQQTRGGIKMLVEIIKTDQVGEQQSELKELAEGIYQREDGVLFVIGTEEAVKITKH